jgi:regulator of PEP synthase PpsR (kinase-PPPase family)
MVNTVHTPRPVYVVSDGTGDTGEKVVRAALRQFRGPVVHVQTFSNVCTGQALEALIRQACQSNAMIVATLVNSEMRREGERLAAQLKVYYYDLLGSLLSDFERFLSEAPAEVPGLFREVNEEYFRRIHAVEFTVKADDGKEPRVLRQADIVLVGVSRTSKTPLSTFLAHKGFKVGNVPLVLDRPPPNELWDVDPQRIMALTIDPSALRNIRRARMESMGMPSATNYGDIDYILAELEYANELFASHPSWPIIDVTSKAVEETAAIILRVLQDRKLTVVAGEVSQL